jgi:[ribosomal protein S5]-alanine N-acetyltransferase
MNQHFDTERLRLRKLSLSDACFIYELVNTTGWIKNIGDRNVHSIDDAQSYIQKIIDNTSVSYWTVNLQNGNFSTGIVTLIKRDFLEHHDIGFAFLPQYTQKGYACEATKAVLDQITNDPLHNCILAITIKDNSSSIRLLEKLGFVFEKEIETEKLLRYALTTVATSQPPLI